MNKVKYEIPNISCGHCVNSIQVELNKLPGVSGAWADQDTKFVEIEFDHPATEDVIMTLLESINYPVNE
jgi:copper chaperone